MPTFSPFADRMMLYMYCHRTSVLKPWFNRSTLTKFHNFSCGVGVRCFFSSRQENLVDKVTSLPVRPPPQSLSSALMFVPPSPSPSPSPRVNVDPNKFGESESEDHHDYFQFFSPAEQTKIRVKKKLSIPWQKELLTPDDAVCVGSSHGWLAFVHSRSCCPYLFNPLIQSSHLPYVPLPPYETFPDIRCARAQKSYHLSPTSSLVKDFILLDMRTSASASASEYSDYENRYADKESKHFIQKVAMSSAPSLPRSSSPQKSCNSDHDDNCTVMVIDREEIYFCKLGEERWHILDKSDNAYYDEIMYFSKDQRFYTMAGPKHIEAWDLSDPSSPKREMINPSSSPLDLERTKQFLSSNTYCSYLTYLVESSGDLLLVFRFYGSDYNGDGTPCGVQEYDPPDPYTKERVDFVNAENDDVGPFHQSLRFDVYKLNFDQNKWEFVECLGDRALFVGCNHSFSLSTRDYPELSENSIYFTDDYQPLAISNYTGHDNGIFHLKDNSVKPYHPLTLNGSKLPPVEVSQPVWVAPNNYSAL